MDPNILNIDYWFKLLIGLLLLATIDTTTDDLSQWWNLVYKFYQQNMYSKPMLWIGIYIALASLYCVLAMVADLLHWFAE